LPRALILVGPEFEDIEALYPYYRLLEAGFETLFASKEKGTLKGKHGYEIKVHLSLDEVNPKDFDLLVIPGGRGPERIRIYREAVEIVAHFMDNNKPVAAICHGPQLLISARRVSGRRLTSYWGIKDDVEAAGGLWVDEPVVVDDNLVTSRYPGDIHLWMREFFKLLERRGLLSPVPKER
jgi:protease I